MAKKKVSFYIPCFNAEKSIAGCIEGVLSQSYPVCEILVIDDCSGDHTAQIASHYPVKIIRHKKNMGLSPARNTALKHTCGDFVAAVDADVLLDKYWLEHLMGNFISGNIAGAGGRLFEANSVTVADRWRQINMAQNWGDKRIINPYALVGSNNVYRRKCLEEAGGYNENFTYNHEDTDMSLRIKMLKYKIVYDPRAIARHLRSDNIKTLLHTYWRYYKAPEGELKAAYTNFIWLRNKIAYNFNRSGAMVSESMHKKRYHLLYPDILCGLRNVLEDIIYIGKYSKIPDSVVAQTFWAALAGLRYSLEQKEGVSSELIGFVLEDLSDLVRSMTERHRFSNAGTGSIYGKDRRRFQNQYKRIKSLLPRADFEFIRFTLSFWKNRFKLRPMTWKMAEVSARRVRHEEEFNPDLMPGLRVMLVNPPWRCGKRFGVRAGSRWPQTMESELDFISGYLPFPFFLAYATAVLKKNRMNAVIVDAIAEGLSDEEFLERARGFKPDLVLIEAATASIFNDLKWARKLKETSKEMKIVFSGTHVSALKEAFLAQNPQVDYLIVGEYEFACLELARKVEKRLLPEGVPGIIYRDKAGRIISNGRTEGIAQLDALPYPERLTLPIYNYNDEGGTGTPSPTVQVMASRGCPFGCIFCLWPQVLYGNKKYRPHQPARTAEEIELLIKEYGFRGVYFDDDTFNIGKERILKLCREIKRRRIQVPWSIMARADSSDYRTLKAMRDAGLCALKLGVESASQHLLDNCGKGLDLKAVEQAVEDCRKLGIRIHLTFTLGLPGETKETIKETIFCVLRLNPHSAQFSLATPFPGTEYYNLMAQKRLLLTRNWNKYDGSRHAVVRGENLSARALEDALSEVKDIWQSHCRQRQIGRHSLVTGSNRRQSASVDRGKIAIVDLLFRWPPIGGASCDIQGVGENLAKEGFSVQMFVPLYDRLFIRGAVTHPLSFPVHQLHFRKAVFTPENISHKLREAVDSFDPDYVIISDGWGLKPYVAHALRRHKTFLRFYAHENLCLVGHGTLLRDGAKCPYNFLSHRDKCLECVNKIILHKGTSHYQIKELILARGLTEDFHRLVKGSLRQMHGIIVSNPAIAAMLSGFNKNIHIIPGGVDIDRFKIFSAGKPRTARKIILMTGRVDDEEKGLAVLMAAAARLWRKRNDFLVKVTSKKKINKPFIRSTGWIAFDKLPALYRQADICVFPSLWPEPFGLVAVEAMAAGKPIIASKVGGLRQIVCDKENGFLVKPADAAQLAEKIEILLDEPLLRAKMGRCSRKIAEEKFSWRDIIKKHYLPLFTSG